MRPHESEGIAFFRVVYTLLVMILPLGTSNKKWSNILRGGLYLTAFSSAQQSQSPTNVLCGGERLRRLRSLMFSLRCNDTSIARAAPEPLVRIRAEAAVGRHPKRGTPPKKVGVLRIYLAGVAIKDG